MMPGISAPRDYSGIGAGGELTAAEEAWVQAGSAGTLAFFTADDVYFSAGNGDLKIQTTLRENSRFGFSLSSSIQNPSARSSNKRQKRRALHWSSNRYDRAPCP